MLSVSSVILHCMKRLIILTFFCLAAVYGMSQGCAQCKLLAEQSNEVSANDFGRNINTGILFLMAIPYCILMFLFRKQIGRFIKRLLPSR